MLTDHQKRARRYILVAEAINSFGLDAYSRLRRVKGVCRRSAKRGRLRSAEREITAKIADDFAAGTLVVWDVDLLAPDVIRKFVPDRPAEPVLFRAGEIADAEPAVPGWRLRVDALLK